MKIGIFGGTFDPPHTGHIALAEAFVRELKPDRLIVLPNRIPPHKALGPHSATPRQRYEMCVIAFGSFAQVSDREINRPGKSYTVETLRSYADEFPGSEIFLVVGDDGIASFTQWYAYREILSMATLVTADRTGMGKDAFSGMCDRLRTEEGARIVTLGYTPVHISSSELREGRNTGTFLTPGVREYIKENRLYE